MTGTHKLHVETLQDLPPLDGNGDPSSVSVHGRFVRKRHLSKGLVFGDIQLSDGELLEVMIRAQEGILDFAAIRQINWDVHLGDLVTAYGKLQCKHHGPGHPDGWLFVLHSIQVDELWSLHHGGTVFSYTDATDSTRDAPSVKGSWVLPPSSKAGAVNKYTNMVVLDGFNACKYYFSSSSGANCLRGEQCHFWHGQPEDFKENRRLWMAKRIEQRAKAAHLAGDNGDPHSKIDKAQRSRIFCDWLVESLGEGCLAAGTGVVDVAGGKGDIPIQLWIQRGIPTTLIDPRPMKLGKYNRKLVAKAEFTKGRKMSPQLLRCLDDETLKLHTELFTDCSVLVGMHPDEATEAIVDAALTLGKPFAIVPCCVMSRVFPDRQCQDGTPVDTYDTFIRYLLEKHPSIQREFLPFAGRNQVLYLFDYSKEPDQSSDGVQPAST
ncbi:hypothetical protein PPTG_04175 [Phytophthora nicotianae INRA-310]|uniref:C3H1-type domain-containing protein n=2 Tax=Phytophthora nicotianae (strain INRA-310) TaxID=761204 RepID=W2R1P3_PHYN3|nr:hypothetical protein PPTG_04175 [Phytophthora nicotianae INRA-310]ETN18634.1 hypothetical protein PPTG_04175 [Phytophthora nicotianae INRA-310]